MTLSRNFSHLRPAAHLFVTFALHSVVRSFTTPLFLSLPFSLVLCGLCIREKPFISSFPNALTVEPEIAGRRSRQELTKWLPPSPPLPPPITLRPHTNTHIIIWYHIHGQITTFRAAFNYVSLPHHAKCPLDHYQVDDENQALSHLRHLNDSNLCLMALTFLTFCVQK